MEPYTNLRLLFISLCLVISLNHARSRLAPAFSLVPQPILSPSSSWPSPYELDFAPVATDTVPISPSDANLGISLPPINVLPISPSEAESGISQEPIDVLLISPSNAEPVYEPNALDSMDLTERSFDIDYSADLHALSINPEVKKICAQTDHPPLCLATVLPLIRGKATVDSALQVAVQAGTAFAKQALSKAKKLANKPGTPKDLLMTFKDCADGYETAIDNFQRTLDAFATNDVGTMRAMLSAVITFVGDCQDEFQEMHIDSPFTGYAEKLTEMASNCLAISSLKN